MNNEQLKEKIMIIAKLIDNQFDKTEPYSVILSICTPDKKDITIIETAITGNEEILLEMVSRIKPAVLDTINNNTDDKQFNTKSH